MEEIVRNLINEDFLGICERNDFDIIGRKVCNRLLERGTGSGTVLCELTKYAVNGTIDELNEYIDQVFQLPVGLRLHLIRVLLSTRVTKTHESSDKNSYKKEGQQFIALLQAWKGGLTTPDDLFRHINDMVVTGVVGILEAQRITNLILQEGGHQTANQLCLLHGRSQICSALCSMLEISGIYSGPNSLIVHAHSGSHVELLPTQLCRSEIHFTTSTCMQSTPEIWWEHIGESDRVQFFAPGAEDDKSAAFHRDHLSPTNKYLDQARAKPILVIGDSICMQEATIEVSTVIMVDSLSKDCTVPVLRFVLLLEGSVSAGNRNSGSLCTAFAAPCWTGAADVFDAYRDGETEVNSPYTRGQGSHSSADSNDDENYHSVPPLETQKRYLAVFVSVLDTTPVVECYCPLLDNVLHDQIPTSVQLLAPGLAVVSGSNGLLGLVNTIDAAAADTTAAALDEIETKHLVYHHGGHRSCYSYFNLVEDSLQCELPEGFTPSHRGDAAITAVTRANTDSNTIVLVSGDSEGTICMWEVDASIGTGKLACPPYQVDSEARRIVSMQLSSRGTDLVVALLDRLLLMSLNNPIPDARLSPNGQPNLYVRACLDMLCGTQARYCVTFFSDCIRIWRIVNEARSPAVPGISYKSELDSYADTEIDGQLPEAGSSSRNLDGRRSRLGTVFGEEDLGTYSMDPGDVSSSEQRAIDLEARDNSSTNPRSPIPLPPPPPPQYEYIPGISTTTWLHFHTDVLHPHENPTSIEELEERFGGSAAAVVNDQGVHSYHRRSGTPTWQEVPTADSPSTMAADLVRVTPQDDDSPSTRQPHFDQSISGSSGDETVLQQHLQHQQYQYQQICGSVQHSAPETAFSLNLHSHSSDSFESDESESPHLQYVQLDEEFMQLYAPEYEESSPSVPPPEVTAPPMLPPAPQNAAHPSIEAVEISRAIPGMQVMFGDGVVQFQRIGNAAQGVPSAVRVRLPEVLPQHPLQSANGSHVEVDGAVGGIVLDHTARHQSHFSLRGMVRPFRSFSRRRQPDLSSMHQMIAWFRHDTSERFLKVKAILSILCACFQPPSIGIVGAALEVHASDVAKIVQGDLRELLHVSSEDKRSVITLRPQHKNLFKWLCSEDTIRVGSLFWVDAALGHNVLCSLYLRYCGNKSVAVEHTWQDYLRTYGPTHLRHASRGLRLLTENIRKIDETANIRVHLPRQVGYIVGLYEIYARRVGLRGRIPVELGQLKNLRVLSMGNNHLSGELPDSLGQLKNLQRIVLHQNNLRGSVPKSLGDLGCIVNLAGNPLLHHGDDVPAQEKQALMDLYSSTRGSGWSTKTFWCTNQPVAKWYKVGVLTSHVHSIVMSSNGMEGKIPTSVSKLTFLRMIELATMPGLIGTIPKELCTLATLRRLCICRCGLTGRIPAEIGNLVHLEELQLFGNQLSGSVPASISNLTNLKLLSLGEYTGGNNFTSEPLPVCLASLVNLEALFMANCNIKGALPDWLGALTELRQLDLQRNQLCGAVPASIGKLQNLLYLNIKDNPQLTGRLPLPQLLSLSKLNRLSLVHCNFVDTDYALEALKTHLPRCKVWI